MTTDDDVDPQRRELLGKMTATLGIAGVAAACWPFISSMNPTQDVLDQARSTVSLGNIPPGGTVTVAWQGKPVFITHRTEAQIQAMAASNGGKDPQPDSERVKRPEWLVVIGICTHLGCVPNRAEQGWLCPCHGSVYDDSGRILHGPAPRNLDIPPYSFADNGELVIG